MPNGKKHEKQKAKNQLNCSYHFPRVQKTSFPFPMAQKQKANNHLNCSYPFSMVQEKFPFPKGPETESKQSLELLLLFLKGPKASSPFPRAQKQKANNHLRCSYPFSRAQRWPIPSPKGCSCCWSCFCPYS